MAFPVIAISIGIALVSAGINYYRAKKAATQEIAPATTAFEDIRAPVITESGTIPVLFGTKMLAGPNVLWYGNPKMNITQRIPIVDFDAERGLSRHRLCMLLSFCAGPIDEVVQCRFDGIPIDLQEDGGDLSFGFQAITRQPDTPLGNVTANMFGGHQGDGGILGNIEFRAGWPDQTVPQFMIDNVSENSPAYRGLFTMLLKGHDTRGLGGEAFWQGNSPNIKPISLVCRRTDRRGFNDDQWQPSFANINGDMNPAHILYELIVDDEWGMEGKTEDDIDLVSFLAAATTLHDEEFGLSFLWGRQTSTDAMIEEIEHHIDGVLYVDPATNKYVLKLIRDDFVLADIPTLGPSEVQSLTGFAKASYLERITQISVIYSGLERDKTATDHDQGGLITRGEIAKEVRYPGVTKGDLANRIAARDLRQLSAPLASAELICNPGIANTLRRGDVFNFNWPLYGISSMVMRVVSVDYGSDKDRAVAIRCVSDVFRIESTVMEDPEETEWTDPIEDPVSPSLHKAFELPLYLMSIDAGISVGGDLWTALASTEINRACLAMQRAPGGISWELWSNSAGQAPANVPPSTQNWSKEFLLGDAYIDAAELTTLPLASNDLELEPNDVIINSVSGEMMRVLSFTEADPQNLITVERGIMDTTPDESLWDDERFFVIGKLEDQAGTEPRFTRYYQMDHGRISSVSTPREVDLRGLPFTGAGQLGFADATSNLIDLTYRPKRPYPPGKLTAVQGIDVVNVDWEHRNRITEPYPLQSDIGPFSPEPQVEYLVDVYEEAPTPRLLRSAILDGIEMEYSYTKAMELSDRALTVVAARLRIEVRSRRNPVGKDPELFDTSYFAQIRRIRR